MPHEIHILPAGNTEEHEKTENCKCKPQKEILSSVKVFIHKPADGHEYCKIMINKKWSKIDFLTT